MTSKMLDEVEKVCIELPDKAAFSPSGVLKLVAEIRRMRLVVSQVLELIIARGSESLAEEARNIVRLSLK